MLQATLLWSHMCFFYITVVPIRTCSLMLTLERGIASIDIQIFISILCSCINLWAVSIQAANSQSSLNKRKIRTFG